MSTLFPPIVDSWLPAFVINGRAVTVPYTMPSFGAGGGAVEYAIRLVNSNKIIKSGFATGSTNAIILNEIDFQGNNTSKVAGNLYKIQLRFNDGAGKISEWSRPCLLKPIAQPQLDCNLDGKNTISMDTPTIYATFDAQKTENLRSYVIKLFNALGDEVYSSATLYTDESGPNIISHKIPMKLVNGLSYKCVIYYTTENGYEDKSKDYTFVVQSGASMQMDCTWKATVDYDNGAVHLEAHFITGDDIDFRRLIITRASSEDNFTRWEDMKVTKGAYGAEFDDFTVKSGVYYNYGIQLYAPSNQTRSNMVTLDDPIRIDLEYGHLTDKNLQFNVKFDTDVSSYKHTVLESKTDTIGSKYPFIRRNAAVNYKQFALSGLISWETDVEGKFINDDDIYANPNLYKDSEIDENGDIHYIDNRMSITSIKDSVGNRGTTNADLDYDIVGAEVINHYDYIYERGFRELVLDFFYNGKAKLFRSTPEGNVLVKLMDISLTPKKELSRMIYSFTCTAIEVDADNIDKYKEYEIIEWDETLLTDPETKTDTLPIAQLIFNPSETGDGNAFKLLNQKHASYYYGHITTTVKRLRYLKVIFYCDQSYMLGNPDGGDASQHPDEIDLGNGIITSGFKFTINDGQDIIVPTRQGYINFVDDDLRDADSVLGPAFNQTIVPAPYTTGVYVFNGDDTDIRTLTFDTKSNYEVYLEYSAEIESEEEIEPTGGTSPVYIYNNKIIEGQLRGPFTANEEIYNKLYEKFNFNFTRWVDDDRDRHFSTLLSFDMVEIEAAPGTELCYKMKNGSIKTVTIDHSGIFSLNNPDEIIESLYFVNNTDAYVNYIVELLVGNHE